MRGHRARWVVVVMLVLTAGCSEFVATAPDQRRFNATVTDVVDGDTVDVRLSDGTTERVRLLGIDTPEVHVETEPAHFEGVPDTRAGRACLERAGENASDFVADRLAGRHVSVETDPAADRRGSYDRLLAYLYDDGTNLNYVLVERGHAGVYPTAFGQRERFEAAARAARAADRGLWRCRTPS